MGINGSQRGRKFIWHSWNAVLYPTGFYVVHVVKGQRECKK